MGQSDHSDHSGHLGYLGHLGHLGHLGCLGHSGHSSHPPVILSFLSSCQISTLNNQLSINVKIEDP